MINGKDPYSGFSLVSEMFESVDVIRGFQSRAVAELSSAADIMFLTGEGSSVLFPARRAMDAAMSEGYQQSVFEEYASDAARYRLAEANTTVFIASNSGKTSECIRLRDVLRREGSNSRVIAITANPEAPLIDGVTGAYVLRCGPEEAVAATKSVIEQALFYDVLLRRMNGLPLPSFDTIANAFLESLELEVPQPVVQELAAAPVVYFAGKSDGVAAELALKTNEILRRASDYLPGTYAVHGIEEVMNAGDVLVWVDPPQEYEDKFSEVLSENVGVRIIAISTRETEFPTIQIPGGDGFDAYYQLAAGWNLLVEAGIATRIDLDTPTRSRKVGNEFTSAS